MRACPVNAIMLVNNNYALNQEKHLFDAAYGGQQRGRATEMWHFNPQVNFAKVAEAYGIAMQLPEDLIKVYASRGIDLPTFDGDNSWRLPVPARIVLAKGGAVLGIEADPDYTRRPEPEETLAVLRRFRG